MKSRIPRLIWFASVLLMGALIGVASCSRPAVPRPVVPQKDGGAEPDAFRAFAELGRYPENPRGSDDWTRLRDGFQLLASQFGDADAMARYHLTPEDRKFLETEAHLTDAELAEIDSSSLRTADAHYLDECFLLRAAARALDVKHLDSVEQTQQYFRWVMRNIILHEQVDTWVPPAFALRRGHAGALDRALVFLALLRQARGDGCLIVVPDSDPLLFLIAVHDTSGKSLRLFDPRLETAVRGKDGKSIATLQEARTDPALLEPAGITKEQVATLEARLVCPLHALAPRMIVLQKGLRPHDPIVLYRTDEPPATNENPSPRPRPLRTLLDDLAAVAKIPVKVWNAPSKGGAKEKEVPPNSPTRALRLFLSPTDGGIDVTNRALAVVSAQVPMQNAQANYASINMTRELLPEATWRTLFGVTQRLFLNFDLQTRELFLRGQHEALSKRQERLLDFARNDTLAGLAADSKFRSESAEWLDKLKQDRAKLGDQMLEAMWPQDELLGFLLDVEKAMKIDPINGRPVRELKATVLTRIVAVGVRDYFHYELARSQAAVSQEKAEHQQARLRAAGKPSDAALARAEDAWILARSSWGNFYVDRIAVEPMIDQRLARLREPIRSREFEPAVVHRLHLLETLHLDVHKYFQARLRCAECLLRADRDGDQKAREYLLRTKQEIEDVEKKGLLHAEIKKLEENVPSAARAVLKKRLDLLANDWAERGSYYWLKRQIDMRLKSM